MIALSSALLIAFNDVSLAQHAIIQRTDTGEEIATSEIARTVTETGLLARIDEDGSLAFFSLEFSAVRDSTVYLAASSENLIVAVLSGQIATRDNVASPGQVFVNPVISAEVLRFDFDIDAFIGSSSLVIGPELRAELEVARVNQERKILWGLLTPSLTNVQAAVLPGAEALRRSYLLSPEIFELRRSAAGDPVRLARLSAERFLRALAARDAETVSMLLSPTLFKPEESSTESWLNARGNFARLMATSDLPTKVVGARFESFDGHSEFILLAADGSRIRLNVGAYDTMTFITALEMQSDE